MATVEELQSELASLREEVRQLRASITQPTDAQSLSGPRLLSRRNLLRVAPAAAIGAGVAVLSASPAAAATGDAVLQGQTNAAGAGKTTGLSGGTTLPTYEFNPGVPIGSPVALDVTGGIGTDWVRTTHVTMGNGVGAALSVKPDATFFGGAAAEFLPNQVDQIHSYFTHPGVVIKAAGADGLVIEVPDGSWLADNVSGTGARISVESGTAVVASATSMADAYGTVTDGVALRADATSGTGIETSCVDGHAVTAKSTSTSTMKDAVSIDYAGKGRALYAESHNTTNVNGTVTGVNDGNGTGVWGEQRGSGAGYGLVGAGGKTGRGARLSGGAAGLQILPSTASTHPTTGKAGDFFVDSTARLWYCLKTSTSTTGATWKQLA